MTPTFEPANLQSFRSATQPKLAKFIGLLALAVLYLLPGLIFSYRSVQEPWTLFRLARASLSLPGGHILRFVGEAAAYRGEHIGGELLQSSLIRLTGLPLESLALLPLGSLLLPALTFAAVRVISRSTWLAVWLALFSAWYYPRLYAHYAVQTYVWTDALFLCFVLLFWLWLQRPSAWLSLLLALIFAAAFLHYQTTPLWMIAALFSGVLLARWRRGLYPEGVRPPSWALPLVFLVVYLQFDTVFYGDFLGRLRQEPPGQLLATNFTGKVLAPLAGWQPLALGKYGAAPLSPRLATWTTLLAILALSLPVLAWCLWKFARALRSRRLSIIVERVEDIFAWSLLLVFGVHTLLYAFYGAVSLRLIDLLFPLLLPVVLWQLPNGQRWAARLAPALAACALVGCLSYTAALQPDVLASETGQLANLLPPGSRLLADANTFGGLQLSASREGKRFELIWPAEVLYADISGQQAFGEQDFDYLVADRQGKPVTSRGWIFYQPWVEYLPAIDANPGLDKIYTNSTLSVFQPAGKELPPAPVDSGSSRLQAVPVWLEAGRLFLAVLWLLFIPGAILGLLLLPKLGFQLADAETWLILLPMAVGMSLSVHTLVGYLANFTRLGLGWQQSLVLVMVSAALAFLATRRMEKPPAFAWLAWLPGIAILAVWALGAALVDYSRSASRGPGLEFFLAASGNSGRQVLVTIVNSSSQPQACSLYLKIDGRAIQAYGAFNLTAGAVRRTDRTLPEMPEGERLAYLLECADFPALALHLNPRNLSQEGAALTSGHPYDPP